MNSSVRGCHLKLDTRSRRQHLTFITQTEREFEGAAILTVSRDSPLQVVFDAPMQGSFSDWWMILPDLVDSFLPVPRRSFNIVIVETKSVGTSRGL